MNDRELEAFKNLLQDRRRGLLNGAESTIHRMVDGKENFPEPVDRAALESDRNATLRIRDRERKLINKIDDALDRIGDGTYGICDGCGEEIGAERLRARPVTTLCIECKSEQESQEKRD